MFRLSFVLLLATALAAQPRFPKPDPAGAYGELKLRDAADSPLRTPREDWEGARTRVQGDPVWGRWLAARQVEVDAWMATRSDRAGWVAGWWHDFVSPKDGSFLTWTPDPPGEATLGSPSDPRVTLTPKLMGGWVFGFRSRHVEKIVEAAQLFRLTGISRYRDWAAGQLDFYAENYERWPLQTLRNPARLMHQSLDDATITTRLVRAAALLGDGVPQAQRKSWYDRLLHREALLLDESMQRVHNIATWQRTAMAMAAIYGADEQLWKRAVDGPFGLRRQMADGITGDYFWLEQSLGYNAYVVSAVLPIFYYASLAGRGAELKHEMEVAENLLLAPLYLRFPTGQLPTPADATGGPQFAPNRRLLASAWRLFPTALGIAEASGSRDWDALLDPAPTPAPGAARLPEVQSRHFESTRFALLRKGEWQVFFHYGQLDSSHAQAEALNYEAFHGDTDLTHDPGTVGYGSPLHRGYYQTAAAHNVPLWNGAGQARWDPGESGVFDPAAARMSASQPRYRPGVSASRELSISEGSLVDRLTIKGPGEQGRPAMTLHFQGALELPAGFAAAPAPEGAGFEYWTNTRAFEAGNKLAFRVRYGTKVMEVGIEAATPLRAVHGSVPDAAPRRREALYLETTGVEATFTTIWSLVR
jgi:hypothetical protein